MNPEAAGGVQAQPGGVTGAIFVERGDGLCFAQQIQGKLHPGEQRVGGRGKSREQFKGALSTHLPACAARLMRRLFGSLQQCCCIVAFANAALKRGEK